MPYYSYLQARPNPQSAFDVFYVGKGTLSRCTDFSPRNPHHANVVAKYGAENIQVGKLECSTEDLAFELEKGLIKCLRRMGVDLTNIADGGKGGFLSGDRHFTRTMPDKVNRGEKHYAYGKPLSAERKKQISDHGKAGASYFIKNPIVAGETHPMYGRHHSEESKQKMAIANAGKTPWNKGIPGPSIPHSWEAKMKISSARAGGKWITNGEVNSFLRKGVDLPDGWRYGKINKALATRQDLHNIKEK